MVIQIIIGYLKIYITRPRLRHVDARVIIVDDVVSHRDIQFTCVSGIGLDAARLVVTQDAVLDTHRHTGRAGRLDRDAVVAK